MVRHTMRWHKCGACTYIGSNFRVERDPKSGSLRAVCPCGNAVGNAGLTEGLAGQWLAEKIIAQGVGANLPANAHASSK